MAKCNKCGGKGRDTRAGLCDRCAFPKSKTGGMSVK